MLGTIKRVFRGFGLWLGALLLGLWRVVEYWAGKATLSDDMNTLAAAVRNFLNWVSGYNSSFGLMMGIFLFITCAVWFAWDVLKHDPDKAELYRLRSTDQENKKLKCALSALSKASNLEKIGEDTKRLMHQPGLDDRSAAARLVENSANVHPWGLAYQHWLHALRELQERVDMYLGSDAFDMCDCSEMSENDRIGSLDRDDVFKTAATKSMYNQFKHQCCQLEKIGAIARGKLAKAERERDQVYAEEQET